MVEKIISDYIAENKRLIVPNFGAFLKGDDGGVRFVELLKNNDGVLISLVCKELSVDELKASVVINNFITKVKQDITLDGEFTINEIGSLTRTSEGLYRLITQSTSKTSTFTPKDEEQPQYNEHAPLTVKQEENSNDQAETEVEVKTEVKQSKYTPKENISRKKMDFVMIIAIIVAVIALGILVYGFLVTNNITIQLPQNDVEQQTIESVE